MMEKINEALSNVARRARAFQWVFKQQLSTETIAEMHQEARETCKKWLNTPEMKAFMAKLVSVNTGLSVTEDGKIENRFYFVNKIHINVLDEKLQLELLSDDFKPYGVLTLPLSEVMDFAKWRSTWQVSKQ